VHDAPEQPPKEAGELESGLRWSCLRSRSDSGESLVLMRENVANSKQMVKKYGPRRSEPIDVEIGWIAANRENPRRRPS
jgi:hypothetical protein